MRTLKGPGRPVQALNSRVAVLASLEYVDLVVPFGYGEMANVCQALRPDVLVKGADWKDKGAVGSEFAGRTAFVDYIPQVSTTLMVEKIKTGSV